MKKPYDVKWAAIAEQDLTAIIKYIHSDNPLAAKDSLEKIKAKVSNLESLPHRGRIVPELMQQGILQYRELVIPPWRIIYRISDSNVYVFAVFDSRQNVEDILLNRLVREI
ncbi:MAG: type II toxin-antitoxin system mRNA interferase toxin, RelE/StbE family [Gammaproteobacteria bacterium]|nr:type II toxin-antitoxin system mRNA interferase toxin, RelE/StbE family [Gammaproteobacteria bacterium]